MLRRSVTGDFTGACMTLLIWTEDFFFFSQQLKQWQKLTLCVRGAATQPGFFHLKKRLKKNIHLSIFLCLFRRALSGNSPQADMICNCSCELFSEAPDSPEKLGCIHWCWYHPSGFPHMTRWQYLTLRLHFPSRRPLSHRKWCQRQEVELWKVKSLQTHRGLLKWRAAGRKLAVSLLEPWASVYFPSLSLRKGFGEERRCCGGTTGMSFEECVPSIYSNNHYL